MSEYIEIETEAADDPRIMHFTTNLPLTADGEEIYGSPAEMEAGSPLAQALAPIHGLRRVHIIEDQMTVTSDGETPWHVIVAEITAAIKDFFL